MKNIKMIKGWLKEAPRRHFGGSWEGFRGYDPFKLVSIRAPGLPEKRLKSLYILIYRI